MRLLLVGTRDACERLRAELDHTAITIGRRISDGRGRTGVQASKPMRFSLA